MTKSSLLVERTDLSAYSPNDVLPMNGMNMRDAANDISKMILQAEEEGVLYNILVQEPSVASVFHAILLERLEGFESVKLINLAKLPDLRDKLFRRLNQSSRQLDLDTLNDEIQRPKESVVTIYNGSVPVSKLDTLYSSRTRELDLLISSGDKRAGSNVREMAMWNGRINVKAVESLWRVLRFAVVLNENGENVEDRSLFEKSNTDVANAITYCQTDSLLHLMAEIGWGYFELEGMDFIVHPVIAKIADAEMNKGE